MVERRELFELSKDTQYLALVGELWVSAVTIFGKTDYAITAPLCNIKVC